MFTGQWMDVIRLDILLSFQFRFVGPFDCQDCFLLMDWKLLVCYGIWNGFTFCGFDTITKVKSEWAWWTSSLLKFLNAYKCSQKYNCSLIVYVNMNIGLTWIRKQKNYKYILNQTIICFSRSKYDSDKEIVILFVLMDIFVKNIMFLYSNCAEIF